MRVAVSEVGHNYASALIDTLRSPEDVQKVGADLEAFASLLTHLPAMVRVLGYPGLPIARRRQLLDDALARLKARPASRRFLTLVLEKGRVPDLPGIVSRYNELRDARMNVQQAEVVTAAPVDKAARARWESALARLTGRKVRVTFRTDGALLGGALTRVGSVVYDGSLRRQLSKIRGILLGDRVENRA